MHITITAYSNPLTTLFVDRWFPTEYSADWWFEYFLFFCVVSDDKTPNRNPFQRLVSRFLSSSLPHSIFHEDLNSFFIRLGFIVVIPLKKSVDSSLKWVNDKRVSQSVECLWIEEEGKYVVGDGKFFVHCWRNSRQATIAREMSDDSMIEM